MTIAECRIAYIRRIGQYGIENYETMEKLKSWAKSSNLFTDDSIIFGIARDNAELIESRDCRYDACIIIPDDFIIKDDYINESTLVGGKYIVFEIEHTSETVIEAWKNIFPYLENKRYKIDFSRSILERYIPFMINKHLCEICIPI